MSHAIFGSLLVLHHIQVTTMLWDSANVHQKIIPNSAAKEILEIHFQLFVATQNKK